MTAFFDAVASGATWSAPVHFVAYLIIGVAVGALLGRRRPRSEWAICLSLIGVCGAWIGSEIAYLFGRAASGGLHQLFAAAIGAAALAYAWRQLHPADPDEDAGIAIHRWHA